MNQPLCESSGNSALTDMNLILADHSLMNYVGHSFEYARALKREAESKGARVSVLAA